jgi:hypothetical protein
MDHLNLVGDSPVFVVAVIAGGERSQRLVSMRLFTGT